MSQPCHPSSPSPMPVQQASHQVTRQQVGVAIRMEAVAAQKGTVAIWMGAVAAQKGAVAAQKGAMAVPNTVGHHRFQWEISGRATPDMPGQGNAGNSRAGQGRAGQTLNP